VARNRRDTRMLRVTPEAHSWFMMEAGRRQIVMWQAVEQVIAEFKMAAEPVAHAMQEIRPSPTPSLQMGDRVAPESRPGDRGAGRCPRCNERHFVGQYECRDFRKGES